jgi:hypothetical protein
MASFVGENPVKGSPPFSLEELAAGGSRRLRELLISGEAPDPAALAGWEYRGVNMPATVPRLLGIRRFLKGFVGERNGRFIGYNKQVVGSRLEQPWTCRPQRDGREAYAYFVVRTVDPEAIDNRYPNAVLFDYGAVPEPESGGAARLRDYVVRVTPGSDDLLLGRAFLAAGRRRVPVGWFAIERANRI